MKNEKKIPLIALIVIAVLVILAFVLDGVISNKIKSEIELALGANSSYEELDVNLLQRRIQLKTLNFNSPGRNIKVKEVNLEGIAFYHYLKTDEIKFSKVILMNPDISFFRDTTESKASNQKFNRHIQISSFQVKNGILRRYKKDSSQNEIYLRLPELKIAKIEIDSVTIKERIPFKYKTYYLKSDSLRLNLNPEHFVAASFLEIDEGKSSIKDFRIVPYYGKADFDKAVPYEKDRISLRTKNIELSDLQFHFERDTLILTNPNMTVTGANLQVYRNKELPDDPSRKPLYAELLRKSPVKINFKKVAIKSSTIEYEEKVETGRPTAKLGFYNIDAEVENVVNVGLNRKDFPQTKVNANAIFQKQSPVHVDWSFDVNNLENGFLISGNFGKVPASALNPMMKPSMNMKVEGAIEEAYFTFTGNEDFLSGDVRLNYDNFRIVLLKKNGKEEKGFLSALVNLFVDNNGLSGENAVKEIEIPRDKQRSFWNYVWNGLRKGMSKALKQI